MVRIFGDGIEKIEQGLVVVCCTGWGKQVDTTTGRADIKIPACVIKLKLGRNWHPILRYEITKQVAVTKTPIVESKHHEQATVALGRKQKSRELVTCMPQWLGDHCERRMLLLRKAVTVDEDT